MPGGTGERFKKIADDVFEGNVSSLARSLEMSPGAFNKYLKGDTMPGGVILKRLILLDINPVWLLTGKGKMFLSELDPNSELSALEKENLDDISARIKWVRIYYRKTISEMAGLCHVSTERQLAIEKGEKDPWEEYISRLLFEFDDVRKEWLIENKPPKLHSASQVADPSDTDYFADINQEDLNEAERRVFAEVKQFSDFLRNRPLNPRIKRLLLEQLIQSIDQAIEQRERDPDHN